MEKVSKSNIDKLETVIMRPQLPCTSKRWDHAKVYNSSKCQSWLCIHWHTPLSHVVSGQWSHNLVPINLMAADQPLTNWHISRQLQLFFWISLSCIYIYIQYDIIYPMWYRTILYYTIYIYSIYPKIAKLDIHLPPHSKPHFFYVPNTAVALAPLARAWTGTSFWLRIWISWFRETTKATTPMGYGEKRKNNMAELMYTLW